MPLQVEPILPRFGAELSGVDITRPLSEPDRAAIFDAMARYGVCVFRDTGLDDVSHIAFSRYFGHLETLPVSKGKQPRFDYPELFDATNLTREGEIVTDPNEVLLKRGNQLWHTDSSFIDLRSAYSLLLAHEVPAKDGATWFADTRSAYEDLPDAMKARLEGLVAEHSIWWSRLLAGYPFTEAEVAAMPSARHPMVHTHAPSGRKALYIAAHARLIEGMERDEARALIAELIAFATQPQYVFSLSYAVGDLVIWDNLCSMHRGGEFDELHERRDMRRTTVREADAPAFRDDPFGDSFTRSVEVLREMRSAAPMARS